MASKSKPLCQIIKFVMFSLILLGCTEGETRFLEDLVHNELTTMIVADEMRPGETLLRNDTWYILYKGWTDIQFKFDYTNAGLTSAAVTTRTPKNRTYHFSPHECNEDKIDLSQQLGPIARGVYLRCFQIEHQVYVAISTDKDWSEVFSDIYFKYPFGSDSEPDAPYDVTANPGEWIILTHKASGDQYRFTPHTVTEDLTISFAWYDGEYWQLMQTPIAHASKAECYEHEVQTEINATAWLRRPGVELSLYCNHTMPGGLYLSANATWDVTLDLVPVNKNP